MSCTIEYNRKVYYWEDNGDKNYVLLIRQGDNNVRYSDTGMRVKDWKLITYGWEYQLWEEIGKRAGYTEGGAVQRAKGFGYNPISIEDYIALYRKAIASAKPIEEIFKFFSSIEFYIERKKKIAREYVSERVNEAFRKYKFKYVGKNEFYEDIRKYFLPITNVEDFIYCLELPRGNYATDLYTSFYFQKKGR